MNAIRANPVEMIRTLIAAYSERHALIESSKITLVSMKRLETEADSLGSFGLHLFSSIVLVT